MNEQLRPLHPLRTGDGKWHNAASHEATPEAFKRRMREDYRRLVERETRKAAEAEPLR